MIIDGCATTAAYLVSGWVFYFVTTGWIFEISLCENSIKNQSINQESFDCLCFHHPGLEVKRYGGTVVQLYGVLLDAHPARAGPSADLS